MSYILCLIQSSSNSQKLLLTLCEIKKPILFNKCHYTNPNIRTKDLMNPDNYLPINKEILLSYLRGYLDYFNSQKIMVVRKPRKSRYTLPYYHLVFYFKDGTWLSFVFNHTTTNVCESVLYSKPDGAEDIKPTCDYKCIFDRLNEEFNLSYGGDWYENLDTVFEKIKAITSSFKDLINYVKMTGSYNTPYPYLRDKNKNN